MKQFIFLLLITTLLVSPSNTALGSNMDSLIREDANLRSGPGTEFAVITALHDGTKVSRLESDGQWVQIDVPEIQKQGWVHTSLVQKTHFPSSTLLTQPTIGIINIQRVLNESQRGIAAKEKFDRLRENKEVENIEKAEEEIISAVLVEMQVLVASYAAQHGFTHILNKNSGAVFYHDDMYDITSDIIKEYNLQVQQSTR